MLFVLLLLLILEVLVTSSYEDEIPKCGTEMSANERKILLKEHNRYRSIVAKGQYKIDSKSGKYRQLPPATRMYKLKYNCSLEKSALEWAKKSKCKGGHSWRKGVSENLDVSWGSSRAAAVKTVTKAWTDEIKKEGMSALEYAYGIGHATHIFWGETKEVGCGIASCQKTTLIVCHYYPQGNIPGRQVYIPGKTLSDCGKDGSKERADKNSGLCVLP